LTALWVPSQNLLAEVVAADDGQSLSGYLRGRATHEQFREFVASGRSITCVRPTRTPGRSHEHVEADAVHEQIAAHDLCGSFAAAEPELAGDVVWGARWPSTRCGPAVCSARGDRGVSGVNPTADCHGSGIDGGASEPED
jgi:hypothetical protein